MKSVYFNGKFYAGGLNGVHRVADRLIREFDEQLAAAPAGERPETTLLCTRNADWVPPLQAIKIVRDDAAPSQVWEQWRLPRMSADGILLNLANLDLYLGRGARARTSIEPLLARPDELSPAPRAAARSTGRMV